MSFSHQRNFFSFEWLYLGLTDSWKYTKFLQGNPLVRDLHSCRMPSIQVLKSEIKRTTYYDRGKIITSEKYREYCFRRRQSFGGLQPGFCNFPEKFYEDRKNRFPSRLGHFFNNWSENTLQRNLPIYMMSDIAAPFKGNIR